MDFLSFGFLALFCVLGGVIAVVADRLGRVLGKQRRSMLGLRPRKTAELIVFLGGVFIPLITILLVLAASSDVRQWLFEGRRAIAEARTLTQERDKMVLENTELEKTNQTLKTSNEAIQTQNTELKKQIPELMKKATDLQAKANDFAARVSSLTGRVSKLSSELKTEQDALKLASQQRQKAIADYNKAKDDFESITGSFNELNKQWSDLNKEYIEKLDELSRLQTQMATINTTIGTLAKDKERLEKDVSDLQGQLSEARTSLQTTQQELDAKAKELAEASIDIERIKGIATSGRTERIMFQIGDEVVRHAVGANQTPQEAQIEVNRLLRDARNEAESRGARALRDIPSAAVVTREIGGRWVTPEEQMEALVKSLVGLADPVVLIATSYVNAFRNEPVALEIRIFRNPVVITAGEIVADARIDGSHDVADIHRQITAYFSDRVRTAAQQAKMIPVVGRADGFGSISSEEVLSLVWRIKETGRNIRLQAVATNDIRAADPLRLEYRLR